MVHGSPGCGKSEMILGVAKRLNLFPIDERLSTDEPTDLKGFPDINRDSGKAGYLPMDTFPIEGDPIPEGYDGWLLFLDELNAADKDVQKASYKLILDRALGQKKLHPNVAIVGAGNLDTDGAMVEELTTALQSRMVHIVVKATAQGFIEHAEEAGFDHRVIAFNRFKPDLFYNFNPDHDDHTFSCPRTWEFASRLIKNKSDLSITDNALLCGTLSEGVGREFAGFCEIFHDLPTMEAIAANPGGTPVPTEPSVQWAITGAIANNATPKTMEGLMTFIKRMPKEFQVVTLKQCSKKRELAQTQVMKDWITDNIVMF
jgi:hypothetical protein